jgi:DNA mismatch repair protein MutS
LSHLEVLEPLQRDAPQKASLFGVMNKTVTPMGARLLRDWLSQPRAGKERIVQRQEAAQSFYDQQQLREELRSALEEVRDIERTIGRLAAGSGNGRDLIVLGQALTKLPEIKNIISRLIQNSRDGVASVVKELPLVSEGLIKEETEERLLLEELVDKIVEQPQLVELIRRSIIDDPPISTKDGGIIREGFNSSLDELRYAMREGKDWIAKYSNRKFKKPGYHR